jgi:hypothetical protein
MRCAHLDDYPDDGMGHFMLFDTRGSREACLDESLE